MPLRSLAKFKLIMSRHKKELRRALGHGLFGICVNPPLLAKPILPLISIPLDNNSHYYQKAWTEFQGRCGPSP